MFGQNATIKPDFAVTSMVISLNPSSTEIFYSSADGEPLAESYEHVNVILFTLSMLRQYLEGQQATVLANQFLYYIEGNPRARVAPDVMVIFNVASGGRPNYKIWEEGEVPSVIFEMTSPSTREQDQSFKKTLYAQLGVQEYWLFDPKGEWIPEQLQGYRLEDEGYRKISNNYSEVLKLQLKPDEYLIGFYRHDTGEKLLTPDELLVAVQTEYQRAEQEHQRAEQEYQRAEQERARADQLAERLRALGIDLEEEKR